MTRITLKGMVWLRISRTDWEFAGGETNPELLKLKNRRKPTCFNYFKLRGRPVP